MNKIKLTAGKITSTAGIVFILLLGYLIIFEGGLFRWSNPNPETLKFLVIGMALSISVFFISFFFLKSEEIGMSFKALLIAKIILGIIFIAIISWVYIVLSIFSHL